MIFLYLGIAMVNFQMYQWDPVFITITFFLCLFVRQDYDDNDYDGGACHDDGDDDGACDDDDDDDGDDDDDDD